ncbi:phosphate acyltransferase PlsX [Lawsonibacter sp. JLR.KK007]|jgi:glycerol-3-phosphate acyltransferase PlsX|uniref:phosphate acyltransferase PlsX n=1 Tax=Lawsonibacter sp. JLR.KK007 TaxID=3114293 RepID=UPI002FF24287
MKIIVDAMGGDNAPQAPVMGAIQANKEDGVEVILVGRGEDILKTLADNGISDLPSGMEIAHASEVVEMCDDPATAFRKKKDSSLTVGLNLLKNGAGDAFISAGSTGALLSAATLVTKRIKGIRRAALAPVVPTGNGGAVLIDCGANAECPPEYLLQFAYMGSYYAEKVLGREKPKVGLLNIGAEPSKGTDLQTTVYPMLEAASDAGRIHFVGNVEAREAVQGAVDVIVSDGYSGNIFLKTMEGTGLYLAREIKAMFMKNLFTKLAALLVSGGLKEFKRKMDSSEVGGTALLGISKPVIKAHGSSDAKAIRSAIAKTKEYIASGIIEDITNNIDLMRLDTPAAAEKE